MTDSLKEGARSIAARPRSAAGRRKSGLGLGLTVIDQALNALTNFVCLALVARTLDRQSFSVFAAQQLLVLVFQWAWQTGYNEAILRSSGRDSIGLLVNTFGKQRRWVGALLPVAFAGAILATLNEPSISLWSLSILPVVVASLVSLDSVKATAYANKRPQVSLVANVTFSVIQIGGSIVAMHFHSIALVWCAWGLGSFAGAFLGYRILVKGGRETSITNSFRVRYMLDSLLINSASQLTVILSSVILGSTFIGSFRGANIAFGPLAVMSMAARAFLIPRYKNGPCAKLWLASVTALEGILFLWCLVLMHLPPPVGQELLGESWQGARQLLLPLMVVIAAQFLLDSLFIYCRARKFDNACTSSRIISAVVNAPAFLVAMVTRDGSLFLITSGCLSLLASLPCIYYLLKEYRDRTYYSPRVIARIVGSGVR